MNGKPRMKGNISKVRDACKIAILIWNMQQSQSFDSGSPVHIYIPKVIK